MPYQFENASVLIVDDMKPMVSLLSSLLRIFGFRHIYTAYDGQEAFKQFCKHRPDIILTDWMMEPNDGIALVERVRKDSLSPNKFVPIIFMTGYSHRIRVERARDAGITEFLAKPFNVKDLYARIERLIEKPRQFVEATDFFGPDRRRKNPKDYDGPFRRGEDDTVSEDDQPLEVDMVERERTELMLEVLRKEISQETQ
ncbi:MAG: response regulator [Alphaproteobacteria bacterium]|nr:response regulator [Alphaproteobacteria bacterium]